MKHIFIINPAAGKGNAEKIYLPMIEKVTNIDEIDHEIHFSKPEGETVSFVKAFCVKYADRPVRFYACGGDGTLNEVVNGVIGYDNAEVTVIPSGTGNDFVKNFDNPEFFGHIERQIKGQAVAIDVIECKINGEYGSKSVAINICNVGVDSETAYRVDMLKKYPFMTGSIAYGTALATVLMGRLGDHLDIQFDDGTVLSESFLLTSVANGICYGGGFYAAPKAVITDGLLEVCLVKKMPKTRIAGVIGAYKNGKHLENKKLEKDMIYKQCKYIRISSKKPIKLCIDGEIQLAEEVEISIIPNGVKFSLPAGSDYNK